MERRHPILIVADQEVDCDDLTTVLTEDARFTVAGPLAAFDALRFCTGAMPMVVLVHINLREISAAEFCLLIQRRANGTAYTSLLFGPSRHHADGAPTELAAVDGYLSSGEFELAPARIAKLIRAAVESRDQLVDRYRGRHLDAHFDRVKVVVDNRLVDLTRRELGLLRFLVTHPNRILSRADILAHVWRNENDGRSRTVDVHIRRLRIKLSSAGRQIQTVTGVGYRFSEE